MKKRLLLSLLLMVLLIPMTFVRADAPQPDAPWIPEMTQAELQAQVAPDGGTAYTNIPSMRLAKIRSAMGDKAPSEEELKRYTPQQLDAFIRQHANEIGVQVWDRKWDEKSQKVISTLLAGPESFEDKSASPKAPQQSSVNRSDLTNRTFLPTVSSPSLAYELKSRMDAAYNYMQQSYQDDGWMAYQKEYPACALELVANGDTSKYSSRLLGQYYDLKDNELGFIVPNSVYVGPDYYWSNVKYQVDTPVVAYATDANYGVELTCDVQYYSNGTTDYQVQKLAWTTVAKNVTAYMGQYRMINDVYHYAFGSPVTYRFTGNHIVASARYTIRHATHVASYMDLIKGATTQAARLNQTYINFFADYPDIYAPMFGYQFAAGYPVDYMFQNAAYPDCDLYWDGIDSTIPSGMGPYRYPYESKVCATFGRIAYIAISKIDYLVPALQAIHVLNETWNPDARYPSLTVPFATTSPRETARWIEQHGWNGFGIVAYGKDPAYASSIRTNAFAALEARLGYVFGDDTSKWYADEAEKILLKTQWGRSPFAYNTGVTVDNGNLIRPFTGGQLLSWTSDGLYKLPPYGAVNEIMDILNMPNETLDIIVTNPETTLTYWAALREILWDKYGEVYP